MSFPVHTCIPSPVPRKVVRLVKPLPAEEVTVIRKDAEVDPREVGLSRQDVDAIWKQIVVAYQSGIYPSITFCLRRHGKVLLDRAIGHSHGNGPSPVGEMRQATPDTPYCIFSASKAMTAMIAHALCERGFVQLEDRIADFIPGFAKHGKDAITLRQVLAHTAGIPYIPKHFVNLDLLADETAILDGLCDLVPSYRPGTVQAYHALTGGYLVAAVAKAVTGKNLNQLFSEYFGKPLSIGLSYGVPSERVSSIAPHECTGLHDFPPFTTLMRRALGVGFSEAFALVNDPRFLTAIIPAASVISTADQACRFYQLILQEGDLDGKQILEPRTVHRALTEQTWGKLDRVMLMPIRYGLGFMLGGDRFSVFGLHTEQAFGHLGFTNILTWADPQRGISAAMLTNGQTFVSSSWARWIKIPWTVAARCPSDGRRWLSERAKPRVRATRAKAQPLPA